MYFNRYCEFFNDIHMRIILSPLGHTTCHTFVSLKKLNVEWYLIKQFFISQYTRALASYLIVLDIKSIT